MAKRTFDVISAVLALALLLPVMAVLAVGVAMSMGRPVLFRQMRTGRHGRDIELVKFRSMRTAFGADGAPLPDDVRVTRFGRILRRFRLDELPEFWQILIGDLSLVGPRPLPRAQLEEHGVLMERSRVRPGLTGLAQVSGNTLLASHEKFAIDLLYVDQHSLVGDVRILLATARTVVTGERRDEPLIDKALRHAVGPDRRGR